MIGKRIVLTLLALILLTAWSGAALAASAGPSDVPPGHWAYQAVKTLIDKGYLQLYQDQTFQGEKAVDRYTLAMVVAKVLNEIAGGKAATSQEDVALLKSLTNEFRSELVDVSSKSNVFMAKLVQVSKENQVIKEDLTKVNAGIQSLGDDQAELRKQVKGLIDEILAVQDRVKKLEDENQRLRYELEQVRSQAETTRKKHQMWIIVSIILGLVGAAK
jgi:predicted  nucleic acid-binding Zn-ribbon protein